MEWRERIVVDPKILVGKPVIKGTRISVEFIVDLLARGWTVEQVSKEYDHLTREAIQACQAYPSELSKTERVYLLPAWMAARRAISLERERVGHGHPCHA